MSDNDNTKKIFICPSCNESWAVDDSSAVSSICPVCMSVSMVSHSVAFVNENTGTRGMNYLKD